MKYSITLGAFLTFPAVWSLPEVTYMTAREHRTRMTKVFIFSLLSSTSELLADECDPRLEQLYLSPLSVRQSFLFRNILKHKVSL